MEKRTYTINAECDWCEETKMVRYLCQDDIPVLAICEGCDTPDVNTYTEFVEYTTTTKENTTMSTTNSSIICEVKDCQKTGKFHMLVWALGFNAYANDKLPLSYQGGEWQQVEMDFCGTHRNVLHRGNAVQLKLAVTPVVSYDLNVVEQRELFNTEVLGQNNNTKEEDTMDITTFTIEELEDYLADLFETGAEISQMGSFAYETEEEFQAELASITDEFNKVEALINNKKETTMPTTKKILCGHCKEYHNTPAEVAECYGVARKTSKRGSVEHSIPGGTPGRGDQIHQVTTSDNRYKEWHSTSAYAETHVAKLHAEHFINVSVFPTRNEHGFWVYWTAVKVQPKTTVPTVNLGVLCGHCKEHHTSAAEVKACYAKKV